MASYWDLYQARIKSEGDNPKERAVAQQKKITTRAFRNSANYFEVTLNEDSLPLGVRIVEDKTLTNPTSRVILMQPDNVINTGDIVNWKSDYWLCTNSDNNDIYYKGTIEKCDDILKYVSDKGEIMTIPSLVINPLSVRTEEGRYMNLSQNQVKVVMPSNEYSQPIKKGMRFILGNEYPYKVVSIDKVSTNGLVLLTLEESEKDLVNDDYELGIADYKSRLHTNTIRILNGSTTNVELGQSIQLNVEVIDNGIVATNPRVWYTSSNGNVIGVTETGLAMAMGLGSATVTVRYEGTSATINVNVIEVPVTNYAVDIVGLSTIKIGMSSTYTCEFRQNGVNFVQPAVWYITDLNGVETTLATITQDGNKATVKANANRKYGTFRLWVRNEDATIINSMDIEIKRLV